MKQVIVGRHKGILPEVYYPGLHFVSPGTERLHVFPTDIQSLDLTNDPNERPKDDKRVTPAMNIQTSEGYTVTVDVSVLYRIEDPYKVLTTIGPGKLYEDALVIPRTEQLLRKWLGRAGRRGVLRREQADGALPQGPGRAERRAGPQRHPGDPHLPAALRLRRALPGGHRAAEDPGPDGLQEHRRGRAVDRHRRARPGGRPRTGHGPGGAGPRGRGEEEARRRGGPLLASPARRGRAGDDARRGRGNAAGERGAPGRRRREPGGAEDGRGAPGHEGHRRPHRRRVRASTRWTSAPRSSASTSGAGQ